MKTWTLLMLMLLAASCGSIPVDTTPAPIDNSLYTLELRTASRLDIGLNSDFLSPSGYLEFPLYRSGEYRIRSKRCNYEKAVLYDVGTSKVRISYSELTANMPDKEFGCIFSIIRFLDGFDRGAQGEFYLVKKENFSYPRITIGEHNFRGLAWYQFRETVSLNRMVTIHTSGKGTIIYEGCGKKGTLTFDGKSLMPIGLFRGSGHSCLYTIGIDYENGKKELVEINFKFYKKEFESLPFPTIKYLNNYLTIKYRSPVAFVSIGDKNKRGLWIRKMVRKDKLVYVKAVTSNSRVHFFGIKGGHVVWTPTILY